MTRTTHTLTIHVRPPIVNNPPIGPVCCSRDCQWLNEDSLRCNLYEQTLLCLDKPHLGQTPHDILRCSQCNLVDLKLTLYEMEK